MIIPARYVACLVAGLILIPGPPARAQAPRVTVPSPVGEVTVVADRLEEIGPERVLLATGNVELTRGRARLTADRVEINRETGDAVARGRVIFYDGEDRLSGERVDYNFRTGTGVVYDGEARTAPYYRLSGERLERIGDSVYRVRQGVFTTCDADPPPWSLRFGSATADLEDFVHGRDASFWVKGLPLIPWLPFFAAPIRRERQTGFLLPRLGTSSRKGFSADLPFFWAISDSQDATIGLQAYERRGVGLNAEYRYVLPADQRGSLRGFFLEETQRNGAERAWLAFRHDWPIAPSFSFKADVKGVTDDGVQREYGDRLQERSEQRVESNVFVTRNWPAWSFVANAFWYQDLTTRRPVELNRLPDLSLQGTRQPIPGLPGLLWELDAGAVRFVREAGSDGTRLDVHPRVSRPISAGGLFTLTPFAGGRLTGYDRRVTGSHVGRDGRLIEQTTDELRVRQLVEVGADVETTASRAYRLDGWQGLEALLHTIEPRVSYTRLDGRTMDRLPAWTDVDRLEDASRVEYSLTNRARGRTAAPAGTEAASLEMVRLVLGHSLDLRENRQQRSGDIVADLVLQTSERLRFRGDLRHGTHGEGVQSVNTDISLVFPRLATSVGTRYNQPGRISFLQAAATADLTRNLAGRFSTNWDLRSDTFVESRIALDFRFQCYAFTLEYVNRSRETGRRGEDEVRFALSLLGVGGPVTTSVGVGSLTGAGAGR